MKTTEDDIIFVARGDSHVREPFFPWESLKKTFGITADSPASTDQPTLYSVGKNADHRERKWIDEAIERNSYKSVFLTLSHGEIDLRCHIQKYGGSEKALEKHLDAMVDTYMVYLDEIKKKHPCVKWILVYGVPPPNPHLVQWMRDPMWGYQLPAFKTRKTAPDFVKALNSRLEKAAKKNGHFYFDVGSNLGAIKKDDFSIWSGCSGMQMHVNGINPRVFKVFKDQFTRIRKEIIA